MATIHHSFFGKQKKQGHFAEHCILQILQKPLFNSKKLCSKSLEQKIQYTLIYIRGQNTSIVMCSNLTADCSVKKSFTLQLKNFVQQTNWGGGH